MIKETQLSPARTAAMRDLATYLQKMRDQERGELARELHDELGALLTSAKLDIASLKSRLAGSSRDIDQRLRHLSDTLNSGIAFSRRVVEGLHPSSLTNLGLKASLEILAREFEANSGIKMSTDLHEVDLDATAQLTMYRIVQESLNNAAKHAQAHKAWISLLQCETDAVSMSIRDDGKGFDAAAIETTSHGLEGMRHRAESCGGQLYVNSEPGRGTVVVAVLPVRGQCTGRAFAILAGATIVTTGCLVRDQETVGAYVDDATTPPR